MAGTAPGGTSTPDTAASRWVCHAAGVGSEMTGRQGTLCFAMLLALGCVPALGCGVPAEGELSKDQCRDGSGDEDRDGLSNCADPDCWVYDFCLGAALQVDGSDAGTGSTAGTTGQAGGGVGGTSSTGGAGVNGGGSGSAGSLSDGGTPTVPCGASTCAAGSACSSMGVCVQNVFPIELELRVESAAVSVANAASVCWDTLCKNSIPIPNFLCTCAPDAQVTILVNDQVAGQSSVVVDQLNPLWPATETPIKVHLDSAQDVISFVVTDFDSDTSSDEIFSCTAAVTDIATLTVLTCTKQFLAIQGAPPPKDGMFRVTASIARIMPQ